MELDRVDRRPCCERVDAGLGEAVQRVENERLDLRGVVGVDVLQPCREHHLAQAAVEPVTGGAAAEAGVDQRLVER